MIIDDFSLQRQVKELQQQRTYLQCQLKCQQLQIQHLETRMQKMENRFLEFLLLQNQQMQSRIQELEAANDVLKSKDIARKRRCTSRTSTHDSQN